MSGLRQKLVREGRSEHRYNGRRTNPKQYARGFGSARPLQGIEPDSTQPVVSSAKADGEPF